MSSTVWLPTADGGFEAWQPSEPRAWQRPAKPLRSRIAYAAAHVVADARGENYPTAPAAVDWDATLGFRAHLWSWGLGVAEAMDTAQRGMGLDWPAAQQLIRRSAALAAESGGRIAAGAGTDHAPAELADLAGIIGAYTEQCAVVQESGARVILMASRQLARAARHSDDYLYVYSTLLDQAREPVILHWLGEAFDPELRGYWGSTDIGRATATFIELVNAHAEKVDGVKVSLLDAEHEVRLRRALPAAVRLYTGDDFNYPELIRGDEQGHSDALLGAFAPIAPAASAALQALDRGDLAGYDAALLPTLALSRHLFAAPTYFYKTGIAFLAWLCGHQPGFTMIAGLQSGRSVLHLVEAFRLADRAGVLPDPDLAARRIESFLAVCGVTR